MTLLRWHGIGAHMRDFLSVADAHVLVVAPYIQAPALDKLLARGIPTTVVTSWREDALISGASSLEAFTVCQKHSKAALYIHDDLHAKVYARDYSSDRAAALIGSANVSDRAMNDESIELLGTVDPLQVPDQIELAQLINRSTHVTHAVYEAISEWLRAQLAATPVRPPFDPRPRIETVRYLTTDLPLSDSPSRLWQLANGKAEALAWWERDALVHDVALFGGEPTKPLNVFLDETRVRFFRHPFVAAFCSEVDSEGFYFGRVKEWLQSHCDDVPTPRRRELTFTVQALYRWIVDLAPERFEIVRPRHSECLRRRT